MLLQARLSPVVVGFCLFYGTMRVDCSSSSLAGPVSCAPGGCSEAQRRCLAAQGPFSDFVAATRSRFNHRVTRMFLNSASNGCKCVGIINPRL